MGGLFMKKGILSLIILGFSLNIYAIEKVVYGNDDRVDYHRAINEYQVLADAVAVQMGPKLLVKEGNMYKMPASKTLGETFNLCPGEVFSDQPATGHCSAFLISEKILVTAGHCDDLLPYDMCKEASWVFGFHTNKNGDVPTRIPQEDVYKCSRIIAKEFNNEKDYAVVELDRPVTGRIPLKLGQRNSIKVDDKVMMIGFPDGIPMKITPEGKITKVDKQSFQATLDAFHGNSGSVVLNQHTKEVVGILVAGNPDYQRISTQQGSCNIVNKCDGEGHSCSGRQAMRGEKVSRLNQFLDFL